MPDPETGRIVGPAALRAGMAKLNWHNWDLWRATMPIGGNFTLADINAIVAGDRPATRGQYNVLAATFHEHIHKQGGDHPIRPWGTDEPDPT